MFLLSLHCLATFICASSCGSFFLSSCFSASGCLRVLSPDSSLLPSSSLTWPVSSAPGWGSPPLVFSGSLLPAVLCLAFRYCLLPLFALLLLAPLRVSMALPLRWLGLLGLLVYMQFCSRALQGFQRPLFLLLFALLLLPPLRVSLALPLRCPGLLRLLVSLRFAPGFSAASSLTPFCAAPVASAAGLFAFPQLRLTPSLISLALLLSLAMLRLWLRCLGLLRLLPSSSLSVWLGSYCPFGQGLWLRSLPVLWLQFLRLSFLTFACLRLRWCLPSWLLSSRWLRVLHRLLFLLALFRGVLPDPSAHSRCLSIFG